MTEQQPQTEQMTRGALETSTEFTLRVVRAEAWDAGYRSGSSNAMRWMSDEPDAPTTTNPYRVAPR